MKVCFFWGLVIWFFGYYGCHGSSDDRDKGDHIDGAALYRKYCVVCHGAHGDLGLNGAADLKTSSYDLAQRVEIISHGKGNMTAFGKRLDSAEIFAIASYTMELKE